MRRLIQTVLVVVATWGVASAEPCREAIPVSGGDVISCSGVLLPDDQARDTLRLIQVEIPMLQSALQREEELHWLDLERDAKIKTSLRAALAQTASDKSDGLKIEVAVVGAAALILGALGGYLAGH